MAKAHPTPIPPFPSTIDRRYFATWLSGFVDGEGCFGLFYNRRLHPGHGSFQCDARFLIKLRHDDQPVLELIRSFLECGRLHYRSRTGDSRPGGNPAVELVVSRVINLVEQVIPHFRAFPLLAKKKRDFPIWEQGVELIRRVSSRKVRLASSRGDCGSGTYPKWTTAELADFLALRDALSAQRIYNAPAAELPAPRPSAPEPPSLFDWLP
jgi:hypothetical protein